MKPKKHFGQHFLKNENIAKNIADLLTETGYSTVLEIGPGMGVLTKFLLSKKEINTHVVEIDRDAVAYLKTHFLSLEKNIIADDFLKLNLETLFNGAPFAIIGNFPYNISSQIVFKTLANKALVPEFAGMFQKEVAMRIAAPPGSKTYGILSVLAQAFYEVEYKFSVAAFEFNPPPKVESGVLHMVRKKKFTLKVDEKLFYSVVKTAFNQRRKTLKNSLKIFNLPKNLTEDTIFAQRPEQLSVQKFIQLTSLVQQHAI